MTLCIMLIDPRVVLVLSDRLIPEGLPISDENCGLPYDHISERDSNTASR